MSSSAWEAPVTRRCYDGKVPFVALSGYVGPSRILNAASEAVRAAILP